MRERKTTAHLDKVTQVREERFIQMQDFGGRPELVGKITFFYYVFVNNL